MSRSETETGGTASGRQAVGVGNNAKGHIQATPGLAVFFVVEARKGRTKEVLPATRGVCTAPHHPFPLFFMETWLWLEAPMEGEA